MRRSRAGYQNCHGQGHVGHFVKVQAGVKARRQVRHARDLDVFAAPAQLLYHLLDMRRDLKPLCVVRTFEAQVQVGEKAIEKDVTAPEKSIAPVG